MTLAVTLSGSYILQEVWIRAPRIVLVWETLHLEGATITVDYNERGAADAFLYLSIPRCVLLRCSTGKEKHVSIGLFYSAM